MDNKIVEVFIPGPAGILLAKYYKINKTKSIGVVVLLIVVSKTLG